MSSISQHGSLQIDENMPFQRREWIVQRIGCALMAGVFAAALLGLFGNGPLSRTSARSSAGEVSLEYERFWRVQAPSELRFEFAPAAAREGKVQLWIDRQWVESVKIEDIEPEPEKVETKGHALLYTFAVGEPPQSAAAIFHFQPQEPGSLRGRANVGGEQSIYFQQFIYP